MRTSILSALLVTALAGCMGTGSVQYSAEVTAPELIVVSPGVQVIADYNEPVFYSENYYWRYDGGVWFRSNDYRRNWIRVQTVPVAVRRIDRPTAYIHYRGNARAEVRDHRTSPPAQPAFQPQPPAPPVVRDHEDKAERKDERRDDKAERKDERRDDKAERREDKAERKDERRDDKAERKEDKQDRKDDRKDDKKRGR